MQSVISIESESLSLKELLATLSPGETLTLADNNGTPVALLISLPTTPQTQAPAPQSHLDWIKEWDGLSEQIEAAWQGEKTGLEELAEMRR
jgi:hypothetical protein